MEPFLPHPQPYFSSTGALIPVFGRTFSPTGENRIAENRRIGGFHPADSPLFPAPDGRKPLPIFTIFRGNPGHSYGKFLVDLRAGLRYNIFIKSSNSSAHSLNF